MGEHFHVCVTWKNDYNRIILYRFLLKSIEGFKQPAALEKVVRSSLFHLLEQSPLQYVKNNLLGVRQYGQFPIFEVLLVEELHANVYIILLETFSTVHVNYWVFNQRKQVISSFLRGLNPFPSKE